MIRLILRIYQNTLDAIYVSLLLSGLFRVTRTRPCELSVEKNIEEGTSSTFMKIQTNEIRGGGVGLSSEQHHFMRFLHQGQDALAEFYLRHTPRCPRGRHFLPCAPSACAGSPRKLEVDVRDLPWLAKSGDYLGEQNLGAAHGHQGFGPVSRAKLRLESRRLRSLHRSISWWGFQPFILGNTTQGLPRGYFLEDDATPSNHRVFLVPSGQHRVAVLAHMRFEEIPVTFLPHAPRVVKRSQVELWPGVLDQRFSKSNALAIFASYFRPIGDCLEPVQCEPNAIRGLSGDYPISMD